MTDTTFANSYITTDAILEAYIGANPRAAAVALKAAAAATQAWYCQRATQIIDALPLDGDRYEDIYIENGAQIDANNDGLTQTLEFPRVIDRVTCDYDNATDLPIVPEAVKKACMEEAISLYEYYAGTKSSDLQFIQTLQDAGISSFSLGDLSASFQGRSAVSSKYGLKSQSAYDLLKKYIMRSCPVI
jgi:hypothetical protein